MVRRGLVLMALGVMVFPGWAGAETAVARASSVVVANQGQVRVVNRVEASSSGGLVTQMQEKREELRARYQERLQQIKDERKQKLVERIRVRMCEINRNRTQVMNQNLDRMLMVLNRVEEKAATLKNAGEDISVVTAAIDVARGKIQAAKGAVATQGEFKCEVEISGAEWTLGTEVRKSISGLEKELLEVNEQVREAKRAVAKAVVALAQAMGKPLPTGVVEN